MDRKDRSRMSKSSRVSEKVLEYYMQFGKERELEKFMRFRSPGGKSGTSTTSTSQSSSGDEWAQVGNLKTLFCEQRQSASPEEQQQRHITIQEIVPDIEPPKEHVIPIRIESDEKPSTSAASLKTPMKTKQSPEEKVTQTPESVKKTHKRLEWDSLGDVGYKKSKSTSNISIVERMLLREFFEVKQINSSESDIRLLEQEIAELGTLKKHFIKPSPLKTIQKDADTYSTSPLASSTHVEIVAPKPNVITTGTNTTPQEPKYEKYAQTSMQRPQMTSQEVQVAFTSSASSLYSSVEPSSFEYQHQPSTISEASKSTIPSQVCEDQTVGTSAHPFLQNVNNILDNIARRKPLGEKTENKRSIDDVENENSRLKKLYDSWQNVMDNNKENTSSSDCSTTTSSTPQIDLGIQLICGIMKAKSIDQKQKKRLLRNIVKRLAKVASSCELDSIVNSTASLINLKLGESVTEQPQMESEIRNIEKLGVLPNTKKHYIIPGTLEGGENTIKKASAKTKDSSKDEKATSSAGKSNDIDTKKSQSQTKKQSQVAKIVPKSILVKPRKEVKEKTSPQKTEDASRERKSTQKDVQRTSSPPKFPSSLTTSTTSSKVRNRGGQHQRKSSQDIDEGKTEASAVEKVPSSETISSTTTTTTTTSAEDEFIKRKTKFEFFVCVPPPPPICLPPQIATEAEVFPMSTNNAISSSIPKNDENCDEWLHPMTQAEIEYECKNRFPRKQKDEKLSSHSSTRSSERKVQINWIESEIDRLQSLRCLLLQDNTSTSSKDQSNEQSEEQLHKQLEDQLEEQLGEDSTDPSTQPENGEKLYDTVHMESGLASNKKANTEDKGKDKVKAKPKPRASTKANANKRQSQRSKIDTPTESGSVTSFVRQRKQEFLKHYRAQKLHQYEQMQKIADKTAGICIGPSICPQYPQCPMPNKMAYAPSGNYYTYPPTQQVQTDPCSYIPSMQSVGPCTVPRIARVSFPSTTRFSKTSTPSQRPHTSSSAFGTSSELSVPMGCYGISTTPTTTHQYDDVAATITAPSFVHHANACVQTGTSLGGGSQAIYRKCCTSPILTYNMVPYATFSTCEEVAEVAHKATAEPLPKGIAYALEFAPKIRTKPDGDSEMSSSMDEYKVLDMRGGTSLQTALQQGRPEFLEETKKRKAILNRFQQLRQERERELRDIADDNSSINTLDKQLKTLPPPVTERVRIFPTKVMKAITSKHTAGLPEVLAGKEREREERRKRSNRMLREVFNRRLQQRVRKGKLSMNHSHTVI